MKLTEAAISKGETGRGQPEIWNYSALSVIASKRQLQTLAAFFKDRSEDRAFELEKKWRERIARHPFGRINNYAEEAPKYARKILADSQLPVSQYIDQQVSAIFKAVREAAEGEERPEPKIFAFCIT